MLKPLIIATALAVAGFAAPEAAQAATPTHHATHKVKVKAAAKKTSKKKATKKKAAKKRAALHRAAAAH